MLVKRFLGLTTALVVFTACGETPTQPQPLDSDLLAAAADPGNGAIVDRFTNSDLEVTLTIDFESGLYSVHYTDSDHPMIADCVPEFHGAVKSLTVATPNGKNHNQDAGEVYVIVNSFSGFPGNLCDEPLAEGTIRLHVTGTSGPQGQSVLNFGSNGLITDNTDGSEVRLHHMRRGPPPGTVQLR